MKSLRTDLCKVGRDSRGGAGTQADVPPKEMFLFARKQVIEGRSCFKRITVKCQDGNIDIQMRWLRVSVESPCKKVDAN